MNRLGGKEGGKEGGKGGGKEGGIGGGAVFVVVALAAYIGVEAFAITKVKYRLEPAYIHNLLVEARTAVELCDIDNAPLERRFNLTLARATDKYRRALSDADPSQSTAATEQQIQAQIGKARSAVQALQATTGCDNRAMQDHVRRYEIYAKKSR